MQKTPAALAGAQGRGTDEVSDADDSPVEFEEPEELTLWRQVVAYRDLLVRALRSWETGLARQRAGYPSIEWRDDEAKQSILEIRRQSEAMHEEHIVFHREKIADLDARVLRLRNPKGVSYGLKPLRDLAESFHEHLLNEAVAAVKAHLDHPNAHLEAPALVALASVRDGTPRHIDRNATMREIRNGEGIDLQRLLEDARAERLARNESGSAVARRIVATVAGIEPHSRKLRR